MKIGFNSQRLANQSWDFYGSDVLTLTVMGASLRNQNRVAVFQGRKRGNALYNFRKITLITSHQNGKRRKGDILWNDRVDFMEHLAIGDDHTGRCSQLMERFLQFAVSAHDSRGSGFQYITNGLLLWENQTSFGCGFIKGDDKDDKITGRKEIGYDMALDQMAGESGSVLNVVVLRDGAYLELSATRAPITVQSVIGSVSTTDPKVGILRITSFQAKTPAQFKAAMNELIAAGCERFVFDLRNNLGGEQRSILAILSYFANEDDALLVTVEKSGETTYDYAKPQTYTGDFADCSVSREEIGMYRGYKNVVLTNGYTASAAELFTGTLRDFALTTQVGETTYGKGVKQSIIDLEPYGYTGVLRLTTGYYAPPLGVNYDGVGLVPHHEVAPSEDMAGKNPLVLTEEEDNQLTAAIAILLEK